MPIIVGGKLITIETDPLNPDKVTARESKDPTQRLVTLERKNDTTETINDVKLIVNGKEKVIGKKSRYLLDMLILENDK